MTLDLKSEAGLAQALALIDHADIVIESFRNGVMTRLGVDFQALRIARPELITLSIPGFASNDSLRRDWRAYESVIAAQSGVFTDMGLNRVLMGINPSFSPLPLGQRLRHHAGCKSGFTMTTPPNAALCSSTPTPSNQRVPSFKRSRPLRSTAPRPKRC